MQVETALFFETIEQIYARVFHTLKPRTALPRISIRFRKYANANSRIRLERDHLRVDISDVFESAPAPIHEALADILISKLFRRDPPRGTLSRYRRYLNRADMRRLLQTAKQQRGRKCFKDPQGSVYDLRSLFEHLNLEYFYGLMAQPQLGWSVKPSRTTLGHYDPSHHTIILSSVLDVNDAPLLAVQYVMFHEMLHLRYPTEHRGPRRCVHTAEFKAAEKEFVGFAEAKKQLNRFLESRATRAHRA